MVRLALFLKYRDDNICKSMNVINHTNGLKDENHIIISVVAEIAFNKSPHFIMLKVLELVGIGGHASTK